MIFGPLKYYICQNILFQADLQTLKCKQMIFEVYSIHSYSGILSIEHSLTFPNSNSTWNGRQRTSMWMPFPLNYLFIYLFIYFLLCIIGWMFNPLIFYMDCPTNNYGVWKAWFVFWRVRKILNLRVFDDNGQRWKKSVVDENLEILCVSQVWATYVPYFFLLLSFFYF